MENIGVMLCLATPDSETGLISSGSSLQMGSKERPFMFLHPAISTEGWKLEGSFVLGTALLFVSDVICWSRPSFWLLVAFFNKI